MGRPYCRGAGRMGDAALNIRVTGRVQGVWFRNWTKAEAERLGLTGWVRNEADGSVSALIAGPENKVAKMVAALRRGPEQARVDQVETVPADGPAPEGFQVLR